MKTDKSTLWWIICFAISVMLMVICYAIFTMVCNLDEKARMFPIRGEIGIGLVITGLIAVGVQIILTLIVFQIAAGVDDK